MGKGLRTPLFCFFLFLSLQSFAGTVRGKVLDAATGEPLAGATVALEHTKYTAAAGLDGSFVLRNVAAGAYELVIKMVGYKKLERITVNVSANGETTAGVLALQTEERELSTVVIAAGGSGTDRSVRTMEKNADAVQNILSQRTIQLLPDVTVANALQRMSGVSIERSSSGEGRYAIIRGMDQRYNNTLVNGVKIPSPDDKYRYVPMDIFPSDLLERLEVIKTLTPNMEGDAIGGTMNLVMKNAPDRLLLQANVAGGYSTLFSGRPFYSFNHSVINKKSPGERMGPNYAATGADFPKANLDFQPEANPINQTLGLTFGNRYLKKRLGLVLAASYQNIYRGSNSDFFHPNAQPAADNAPVFDNIYIRNYSTKNQRIGLHNKLDYAFNNRHHLSWYNLYLRMNEAQSRYTVDSSLAIQRTGPGSGNVAILNRSRRQQQSIYNSTLSGDHVLSDLVKLNWSAVYSKATSAIPDWAEYETTHAVTTDASGKATETPTYLQSMSRRWIRNSDGDITGYLNLTVSPKIFERTVELSTGGMYRHKTRDNYYNIYELTPVTNNGNSQPYTNVYDAQWTFKTADQGKSADANPNTYTSTENIGAGYGQAKFMLTKSLQVLGGVRVEHTQQNYVSQMPPTLDGKTGEISYTDWLPSLHFKYALNGKQNLRLSYYKAVSRPSFYEIIPYNVPGEFYDEGGNPYVKHTTADNYDLRYEWFPQGADQILVGAFYKRIYDPIEYSIVRYGTGKQILKPNNFGDATNYGFEAVLAKYFGVFGVSANYTYTKSQITTDKNYYYRDASGQLTTKTVQQKRPLQGQADHIGNASLLYKNIKSGTDAQLAFVYSGRRIAQLSPYYNLDYWQDPFTQLDFSLEQRLLKRVSFYAKITNITNAPRKVFILQPNTFISGTNQLPEQSDADKILVQKDVYKITFLAGFRFKL